MATTVLRLPQVIQRCGFIRSAIYKMVATDRFPAPVHIGVRAVAWVERDIEDWLTARIAASRGKQTPPGGAARPVVTSV